MPKHSALPFHFYVNVDNSFLGPEMPPGVTQGIWHGVYAREYQSVLCHVFLESGAHWSGLPLHALSVSSDFSLPQESLMPWGGMGSEIEAIHFPFLEGLEAEVFRPIQATGRHTGVVIDWADGYSRYPQEHKPLSLISLLSGQFALLPNNYFALKDKHFVSPDAVAQRAGYRRGERVFWEK